MKVRIHLGKYISMGLVVAGLGLGAQSYAETLSLAGDWNFRLDPANEGESAAWFKEQLSDPFVLPGSTDENGYGKPGDLNDDRRLHRPHKYVGVAWYQRTVTIPQGWSGKHINLLLERCGWETRVWVDGKEVGSPLNSLCVAHEHDLSKALTPGKHTITICVDNTVKINIGHANGSWLATHAISEETQTNWNGMIGRIELIATDPVWVEAAQVYPNGAVSNALVKVKIANTTGKKIKGGLKVEAQLSTGGTPIAVTIPVTVPAEGTTAEVTLPMGNFSAWDEFSPALYTLTATFKTKSYSDTTTTSFGMRDFAIDGQHFTMNGRRLYLRGTLDCNVWPLTGHPPMDVAAWTDYLQTLKDYGYNHVRFHSWCPPEAAFVAADPLGLMLQVEAPLWDGYGTMSTTPGVVAFISAEIDRILDTYGNHPSFCLFSTGNELGDGTDPFLNPSVEHNQRKDPRHFYTATTHPADTSRPDDFFVAANTDRGIVRALGTPPFWSTDTDHSANMVGMDRPLISHETGQYCMFVNFDEIKKYTGTLRARNMEIFRANMAANNMLHRAEDFRLASGQFSKLLYKAEYEKLLRTDNIAGFQSLGLLDFPGQGTALIGLLDAFHDSKGILTDEEHRRFLDATVLLLKMPKREWTDDETFTADLEVSHFGPSDLAGFSVDWKLVDEQGETQQSGTFPATNTPSGGITSLGHLEIPLASLKAGSKYSIEVSASQPAVRNEWNFWVLSASTEAPPVGEVQVLSEWNNETAAALAAGRKVLLLPDPSRINSPMNGQFMTVFWNMRLFAAQPGTMGIQCDPTHPALAGFPTDSHTDWQWYDLLTHSKPLLLDGTPIHFRPIVQVIDDYGRNHKLGDIIECSVGSGKLMVCSIDLRSNMENRPVARHLLRSLLDYMNTPDFAPNTALSEMFIANLFAEPIEVQEPPANQARAVLDIIAADKAPKGQATAWSKALDRSEKLESGMDYSVRGAMGWSDNTASAWFGSALDIEILCPVGFEGTAYYYFNDWNAQGRRTHLYFEGRDEGPLNNYAGAGAWISFEVTSKHTADGKLHLRADLRGGPNVQISRIMLIPNL